MRQTFPVICSLFPVPYSLTRGLRGHVAQILLDLDGKVNGGGFRALRFGEPPPSLSAQTAQYPVMLILRAPG